ncbi:hypothetical protein [Nonomuraea maheshkhaliensis]|uniref:hypothetical protein n=1 Tax=Nonomuraea maheshkhaliensis TaxID=419590 RepID=UPI0031F9C8FA
MPRRAHTTVANLRLLLPRIRVTHAAAPLLPRDHAGHDPTVRNPTVRNPAVFASAAHPHAGHGTTPGRLTVDHAAAASHAQGHRAAGTFTGPGQDADVRKATIGSPSAQDATTGNRTVEHSTIRNAALKSPTIGSPAVHGGAYRNAAVRDITTRAATVGNFLVGRGVARHVSTRPANHPRRTLMTAPAQARPKTQAGPSVPYRNRRSGFDVFIGHSRPTSR